MIPDPLPGQKPLLIPNWMRDRIVMYNQTQMAHPTSKLAYSKWRTTDVPTIKKRLGR